MHVSTVEHSSDNFRQLQVELYNRKTPDATKMNKPKKNDFKFPLNNVQTRTVGHKINQVYQQ